jgi:hypothetical protein
MSELAAAVRVTYARSVTLHARAQGHAVNVGSHDQEFLEDLTMIGEAARVVSGAMAATLSYLGEPAPVSWAEMETLSGVPDTMTGSTLEAVGEDVDVLLTLIDESLSPILDTLLEEPDLASFYRDCVESFEILVKDVPWAA